MVCRTEIIKDVAYDYCPDALPAVADRIQSLMHGRFMDELTGNPVNARLHVRSSMTQVSARSSADGVAGLVANPARQFPGLAATTVALNMTVTGRHFLSQTFPGSLGPFNTGVGDPADFPHYFAPVDLGDVGLHRVATVIGGRCVHNNGVARLPLANVTVEITGLWHQFPAASIDPLAVVEAPDILSLLHGLYTGRHAGVDQVRQRTLLPQAGEEKTLLFPVSSGATRVRLSDRVNLSPGQLLAIESEDIDRVEYLQMTAVEGASGATQAATVTLAYPLLKSHRNGVSAVRVNPQPAGAANNLLRDGIPGDQTLFLDALSGLGNSSVEISGFGAPEYHRVHLYSVVSDGDGYFSLPPLSRVAMMQLHASQVGPLADIDRVFSPDYEQSGNRMDLIFT